MHLPPPPDSRELLPPLLACLPTAFVSLRPPPALLPLLSPILRQRVSFLASSGGSSRSDGWLPLLSWSAERGEKLPDLVERMHLEPHPVSGEVELEDIRPAKYRRLDDETLHARLEVDQFGILPTYVWCETDEHGGTGPGWRLAELRSLEDKDEDSDWFDTIVQASDAAPAASLSVPSAASQGGNPKPPSSFGDDDDDYWAAYDRTPGRTPAQKHSPAPEQFSSFRPAQQARSNAETDYYARYGAEVQPALDSHDPDEDTSDLGQSTLNGDSLLRPEPQRRPDSRPTGASLYPADTTDANAYHDVEAPRPISPASSDRSIEKLEETAAAMSEQQDRAYAAIKQHISTDIKSLFRLAKNTGMDRKDFETIVRTELDCLSLLEQDE